MMDRMQKHRFVDVVILVSLLLSGSGGPAWGLAFPGPAPGDAQGNVNRSVLVLENKVLACAWGISEEQLKLNRVTDKLSGTTLQRQEAECFQIILRSGRIVKASGLKIVGKPELKDLEPKPKSQKLAEHFGGKQISVILASSDGNLEVEWRAVLRDCSNYVRQEVLFKAKNEAIDTKELVLLELTAPQVEIMGTVDGSPIVADNMFFAYEHPMSSSQIFHEDPKRFRCSLLGSAALRPGEPQMQSSVIGVVPQGQLRRGFLYYLERERAHPYRPFLHYNSWYDLGWIDRKMQEQECLETIELFGKNLIKQRGVKMDSFCFDDGWDDNASLWQFGKGFPNGFDPLRRAVEKYDSALGTWLSPWGGYGAARQERLKYGREQGFEMNEKGFSLTGPKYQARFYGVCDNMIRKYGINYLKLDGIGAGNGEPGAGIKFVPDVEAFLRLIGELRHIKPDLFVNMTTGTWPSPYWLWYGDSIWRSGGDYGFYGKGSTRQKWITYRDKETYHNIVKRAPLYPLNSIMLHGIQFAQHSPVTKKTGSEVADLTDEFRSYFASGTHLQELYMTPGMMKPEAWDALAEAIKWSRDNTDVLVDTHWVGGDPAKGEVYGWASWSKRKGILSLRNPYDKPSKITVDIGKAFELPKGVTQKYSLKSPWKRDVDKPAIVVSAGKEHTFELKPFEVLVFDAMPLLTLPGAASARFSPIFLFSWLLPLS